MNYHLDALKLLQLYWITYISKVWNATKVLRLISWMMLLYYACKEVITGGAVGGSTHLSVPLVLLCILGNHKKYKRTWPKRWKWITISKNNIAVIIQLNNIYYIFRSWYLLPKPRQYTISNLLFVPTTLIIYYYFSFNLTSSL